MKNLIFITILFFAFTLSIAAQSNCPKNISVTGPPGIPRIGENMAFTAKVEGYDLDKIKYEWTVDKGKISSGQGTPQIFVAVEEENLSEDTATVKIIGLPEKCLNTVSVSYACEDCGLRRPSEPKLIDEFAENPPRIRKERLENLRIELSADPTSIAYIVEDFKRGVSQEIIKRKIKDTFFYLIETLKIPKEKINLQIFYTEQNLTQLWIVPTGAEPPNIDVQKIEINSENYQTKLNKILQTPKKKSQPKKS